MEYIKAFVYKAHEKGLVNAHPYSNLGVFIDPSRFLCRLFHRLAIRHPGQNPQVVRQACPTHRQFPMLNSFGPPRPPQELILQNPDPPFGLRPTSLPSHKLHLSQQILQSPRRFGTDPVLNVQRIHNRPNVGTVATPVRHHPPDFHWQRLIDPNQAV